MPGLRREQVAHLAGVSADYYSRLEQGRPANISQGVLDAVARALQIDDMDRSHLVHLVRAPSPPARSRGRREAPDHPEAVRPDLSRVLTALGDTPAWTTGRRMDVLAMTPLASTPLSGLGALSPARRNFARYVFLDPTARKSIVEREPMALSVAAVLRRWVGRHPEDAGLAVVNNAGLMLLGPIEGADTSDWHRMVDTNVLGLMHVTHAALPYLLSTAAAGTRDGSMGHPEARADLVNMSPVGRPAAAQGSTTRRSGRSTPSRSPCARR